MDLPSPTSKNVDDKGVLLPDGITSPAFHDVGYQVSAMSSSAPVTLVKKAKILYCFLPRPAGFFQA
jgi:hypothetical protein